MTGSYATDANQIRKFDLWLYDLPTLALAAALTFGLCIFFGFEESLFKITAQIGLILVLLRPELLTRFELWLSLAATSTVILIRDWSVFDNHKYLLAYWLWVMVLATYADVKGLATKVLRWHARFFLIFVFLAAAAQKLFSPTYMSGEMFEMKLLLDTRFAAFAQLVGVEPNLLSRVPLEISELRSPLAVYPDNTRLISSSDYVRKVAMAITWYDLLVQIAIGTLFLPGRKITDTLGHACLLFFIYTTYLPAPVFGFGWTLAIWGLILSKGERPMFTKLYLFAFVAILLYQMPWREWVVAP